MLLCQRIARIAAIAPLRAGEEIAASAGSRQCHVPNALTSPIFDICIKKKKRHIEEPFSYVIAHVLCSAQSLAWRASLLYAR